MAAILTDLVELKSQLEIDQRDTSEDGRLLLLAELASELIEKHLQRPLVKKERTEFRDGTNTRRLVMKARPIYTTPKIRVFWDNDGYYGEESNAFASNTELTYGDDFVCQVDDDEEQGRGKSGILLRIGRVWEKPHLRSRGYVSPFRGPGFGNHKVIYTAGYGVDNLPVTIRMACNFLVARIRYLMPNMLELGSDSYEELSRNYVTQNQPYLMSLIKPMIFHHRNFHF